MKPMTDAEFWAVMAITCEKAGTMPDRYPDEAGCGGLCWMLYSAFLVGLIDENQEIRLSHQLWRAKPLHKHGYKHGYWWPKGKLAPRVRAMKKLATLAAKKS